MFTIKNFTLFAVTSMGAVWSGVTLKQQNAEDKINKLAQAYPGRMFVRDKDGTYRQAKLTELASISVAQKQALEENNPGYPLVHETKYMCNRSIAGFYDDWRLATITEMTNMEDTSCCQNAIIKEL